MHIVLDFWHFGTVGQCSSAEQLVDSPTHLERNHDSATCLVTRLRLSQNHTHTHNTHGTQTYSGGLDKRIVSSRSRFGQVLQIFFSVCFASDEPSPTTFIKPIVVAFPCQLFHIEYSLTLPKPFVFVVSHHSSSSFKTGVRSLGPGALA